LTQRTVEFCRESDIPELFACFKQWYAFNPRMQEVEYFNWQFRDCPVRLGKGEYDFLVMREESGAVAGCLGFSGFEFNLNGAIATGGWTHNWYAPDQHEAGFALLSKFMGLTDNRLFLRLNEKSSAVIRLLRVPFIPAMHRWWAVADAARAAELFQMSAPADRDVLARSAGLLGKLRAAASVPVVPRLDLDAEFHFAHCPEIVGYPRRSGRYLNWRYADIPKHDYKLIRSERAFAAFRVETIKGTDAGVVRILEWSFGREETPAALATIMDLVAARRPALIDFHCTAASVGRLLEPYGFMSQSATTAPMPDLFRPLNHSGGYAVAIDLPPHRTHRHIDFDSWYITNGDSDIDRVKL